MDKICFILFLIALISLLFLFVAISSQNDLATFILVFVFFGSLFGSMLIALNIEGQKQTEVIEADIVALQRLTKSSKYAYHYVSDDFAVQAEGMDKLFYVNADQFKINTEYNKVVIERTYNDKVTFDRDIYELKEIWITEDVYKQAYVDLTKPVYVEAIEIGE